MSNRKRRNSFYSNLDVRRALVASAPFWLAAAAGQGISAATFNATDVATLRTAIDNANASATSDEIVLATGVYALSGAALDNANASGDLDITKATGDLVIRPAVGATVTIDGGDTDRVFHINAGSGVTVTIEGITIQAGRASDDGTTAGQGHGGGILLQSGNLTLDGVTLDGNIAIGAGGANGANGAVSAPGMPGTAGAAAHGGGLYVAGGTVQIANSTISNNAANAGSGGSGGDAGISLSSSVIGAAGAAGSSGAEAGGGGIYVAGGTASLELSTVSNNTCNGGAGGAGGQGGDATNTAIGGVGGAGGTGGAAHGAGVHVNAGSLSITQSSMSNNVAASGDGGDGGDGGGGYTAAGNAGSGGTAGSANGGGISFGGSGTLSIIASTLAANAVNGGTGGGGGIGGGITASAGGDGGNGGLGGIAHGGGIFISGGTSDIVNSTVSGNTTSGGDGGAGGEGGTGYSPTFATNGDGGDGGDGGEGSGGGIYAGGGVITISNSTIAGGVSTGGAGGAAGPAGTIGVGGVAGVAGAGGAGLGGGASQSGGTLFADSTIFADGTADTGADFAGNITAGASLFESAPTGTVTPGTGANVIGQDPSLGPLQNNGGPTDTHDIAAASPARDAGSNPLGLIQDQRGYNRDDGGGVDIGAMEHGSTLGTPPPTVSVPSGPIIVDAANTNIDGTATADALVRVYSDDNNNGVIDGADVVMGTHQLTGGATAYSVSVPLAQDADNNFLVTAEAAPSSESDPVDVPTITEDSTPPAPPVITDPAAVVSLVGATYDIQGTAEADSLVRVYTDLNNNGIVDGADAVVGTQQLTGGGTAFNITTPLTVTSANNFVVTAEDARNLESTPANVPTITETTPPPINPPVITAPAMTITLNTQNYSIQGTAQADSLVRIYTDANNNGIVDGTDAVAGQQQLAGGATSFSINVPIAQNSANNFTATATDGASNESLPADVPTIIDDNSNTGSGGSSGSDSSGCSVPQRGGPLALLAAMAAGAVAFLRRRRHA